jgi:NAD(P)-dependent dehydrogenase (short-subunit alcohol dehydrogenase family)
MGCMTNTNYAERRTAVVTGASRGFGRALARHLAETGWIVVTDARHADDLDQALSDQKNIQRIPGDVTDPRHRALLADAVSGGLDLLVNNASRLGPSPLPTLATYPTAQLRDVFEVNAVAPVGLIQDLLPALRSRHGTIVNVSSDAAVEPYEGWGGYGASKAALDQLTRVFAAEQPDLAVYAFDPGDMRTDMHQAAFPGQDISDRPEPESVVPALIELITRRPASGRYRAADLMGVTA